MEYLNVYFDTEFTGLKRNTDLISIGMVSESGATFYAEFNDFNIHDINDWLQENIIDNLIMLNNDLEKIDPEDTKIYIYPETGRESIDIQILDNSEEIKHELLKWINMEVYKAGKTGDYKKIRFISDCYAYDWMLLCDLLCEDKCAINTIPHTSYIPIDLSTMFLMKGIDPDISREGFVVQGTGSRPLDTIEEKLHSLKAFSKYSGNGMLKHNSLWDAFIIKACYEKLMSMSK